MSITQPRLPFSDIFASIGVGYDSLAMRQSVLQLTYILTSVGLNDCPMPQVKFLGGWQLFPGCLFLCFFLNGIFNLFLQFFLIF